MITLPKIMVAPNGARKTKAEHREIPLSISETVETAMACYGEGARALHGHVRDGSGKHVLDAGLYKELIGEMTRRLPAMVVQITTEAIGLYSPAEQRQIVTNVLPSAASIAVREMIPDNKEEPAAADFYAFCSDAEINVQHILYSSEDLVKLGRLVKQNLIPVTNMEMLFVLGRYTKDQQSEPADLLPFLHARRDFPDLESVPFMVCAFGRLETACLHEAIKNGGKARVGFENNLLNADGSIAKDNAERVREVVEASKEPTKNDFE